MILLIWLFGCAAEAEKETCELLCDQLYQTCEYGAYPSYDSCLQGCAFDASEGADVDGLQQCVEKAGCDTFGIVECTHKFGVDAEAE
jgi:hypothetical protein